MKKPMSLREKQYNDRWNLLHKTTLRLVQENGMGVTINEVVDQVGMSTRTFFNYFPTKEDAVLGIKPVRISVEEKNAYISSQEPYNGTMLENIARLFFYILYTSSDLADLPNIATLVAKHPRLLQHRFLNIHECEQLAVSLLYEKIEYMKKNGAQDRIPEEIDPDCLMAIVNCCNTKYLRQLREGKFTYQGLELNRNHFMKILEETIRIMQTQI